MLNNIFSTKFLSLLKALAFGWIAIAGLLLLQFWPDLPHDKLQWLLLIAFGPPCYVLGEAFFGWLLSSEHGNAISPHKFSPVRVLLALAVMFSWFSLCYWIAM